MISAKICKTFIQQPFILRKQPICTCINNMSQGGKIAYVVAYTVQTGFSLCTFGMLANMCYNINNINNIQQKINETTHPEREERYYDIKPEQ